MNLDSKHSVRSVNRSEHGSCLECCWDHLCCWLLYDDLCTLETKDSSQKWAVY